MSDEKLCIACGAKLKIDFKRCTNCGATQRNDNDEINTKEYIPKRTVAALLFLIFLGLLGGHRFYVGKTITGVIMLFWTVLGIIAVILYRINPIGHYLLLSLIGLGIWWVIDLLGILTGFFKDKKGNELKG